MIRNALVSLLDQSRPHAIYGLGEVDVTDGRWPAIRRIEKELRAAVSFHAFILYCMTRAIGRHPVARTYRRGKKLITFEDIDVLTPLDKRLPSGVRIPVGHIVRSAQTKSLAAINWESAAGREGRRSRPRSRGSDAPPLREVPFPATALARPGGRRAIRFF